MIAPENLSKALTKEILRAICTHADSLITELSNGKEWKDTVYHFPFHYTQAEIESRLSLSRTTREEFYRLGAERDTNSQLGALERIVLSHQRHLQLCDPTLELVELANHCLEMVVYLGLFYDRESPTKTYSIDREDIEEFMEEVTEEMCIEPIFEGYYPIILQEKRNILYEINFTPIYRTIFAAITKMEIDWKYNSISLFMLTEIHEHQSGNITGISKFMAEDSPLSDLFSNQEKVNLDEVFEKAQHELPPDAVIAYFDASKKWPIGYPPQKEDYRYP